MDDAPAGEGVCQTAKFKNIKEVPRSSPRPLTALLFLLALALLLAIGLGLGFTASAPTAADLEHFGAADSACTSCSRTTVFHGDLSFPLHLPFCFAFYAVTSCSHLGVWLSAVRYKNSSAHAHLALSEHETEPNLGNFTHKMEISTLTRQSQAYFEEK